MEKQQEILFSIVSEFRNPPQQQSYQPPLLQAQPVNYQAEQYVRINADSKVGGVLASAFKPSKSSPRANESKEIVTPTPQVNQMSSVGLNMRGQMGNGISQTQLLSDICATLMGKQM